MVANMVFRPLSSGAPGYSFAWQIGAPIWLPAYKAHRHCVSQGNSAYLPNKRL
jgi:hypothetical protein